jgi:transposase
VAACARLRAGDDLTDATAGVKAALATVARRVTQLDTEIATADTRLARLLTVAAPATMAMKGIGPDHAGQLLTTAGANPERLRGEASFARLCGVAPIPASSGKTNRHRLHRGGDRGANRALHLAVVVRMRYCQRTRAYVTRRTTEGMAKSDIMRCLKRYLAREVYHGVRPRQR